jgi:hypothetical protein
MLNLKSPTADYLTLNFLEQNPALSRSLLAEAGQDISRVATVIEPVLDAPNRCEISSFYIQAVTLGRTAFLTTNLPSGSSTQVTEVRTSWVLGRDNSCAIAIPNRSISRCHAVIGHCHDRGFYIVDAGSSNGTFVNRHRLVPQDLRFLHDGDLIELSSLRVEFFFSGLGDRSASLQETQV